ncbi:MAG: DNA methyltransferase [Pyrinomonadaceae bacterium]
MAALDGLIAQIEDKTLRERLGAEVKKLTDEKTFGLVFEDHLPELTPLYSEKIRKGSTVAIRGDDIANVWRVISVVGKAARCVNRRTSEERHIPATDLVVVLQFGEPIFPSLVPMDRVKNGSDDSPWHTLIEADNYHALQLLEYLYAGQVDCIYIDPPYNSGARDWKYNNDYVDGNDGWRHSKWLAFMKRRLRIAKRLLNRDTSVLIVTIDEKEYLHLGMLLEQVFPEARIQMVSTMINPANVARANGFGRSDEYIFVVMLGSAAPSRLHLPREWVSSKGRTHTGKIRWDLLRRSGTNAERSHSPGCFYPIYVDPNTRRIDQIGSALPKGQSNAEGISGLTPVLPIRKDGSAGNWQWAPNTLKDRIKQGRVKVGGNPIRGFTIYILKDGEYAKIQRGEFQQEGIADDGSLRVEDNDSSFVMAVPGSQWRITGHDATQYGSRLLGDILPGRRFPFPKSIYAVRDVVRFYVENNPKALIVDFFAGSGTTLTAVNLLNAADGGQRRSILVTNNEVSIEEAAGLTARGLQPGEEEWEALGICRSVTWPRSKFTIHGTRDDGTQLGGEYLAGTTVDREKPRSFTHIGFFEQETLRNVAMKKQLVSMIDGLPQTLVKETCPFIVSEDHDASVLFDPASADSWLDELEGQEHIFRFFIATSRKAHFDVLKARINELLGPQIIVEEKKRPMRKGFAANLAYFKLDFLDKNNVALGRQFHEILALLWLRAGAIGAVPELPRSMDIPAMLIPDKNPFAVLVDESKYREFLTAIESRNDLTHVFLVTDSEDAFHEMASEIAAPNVIQLYRDYLENFMINRGELG